MSKQRLANQQQLDGWPDLLRWKKLISAPSFDVDDGGIL